MLKTSVGFELHAQTRWLLLVCNQLYNTVI